MSRKDLFRREAQDMLPAWRTWHEELSLQSVHASEWIAELANVRAGMSVLDLASGIGDPALLLARRVGARGLVTATDLVPEGLTLLERRAQRLGLSGVRTRCSDMEYLPFAGASFDAVTCRLGLMFCDEPARALSEVRRVLKPGARAAFVVWGSPQQPLFESTLAELGGESAALSVEEAQPGPFRFARASSLAALVRDAGFSNVVEESRVLPWPLHGTACELWRMFRESSPALASSAVWRCSTMPRVASSTPA